jgi:hypothetical protein
MPSINLSHFVLIPMFLSPLPRHVGRDRLQLGSSTSRHRHVEKFRDVKSGVSLVGIWSSTILSSVIRDWREWSPSCFCGSILHKAPQPPLSHECVTVPTTWRPSRLPSRPSLQSQPGVLFPIVPLQLALNHTSDVSTTLHHTSSQ